MPVAEDLSVEELELFKDNYKEIHILELKIFQLYTGKFCGLRINQHSQQQIDQADGEILEILARTKMQSIMQKITRCGNSSRSVDVILRLSLELVEKEIKHCRIVHFEVVKKKKELKTLEREIERLENKKIEIMHVIHDTNHSKRADYLLEIVKHFARRVAKQLVREPINDDELKVALCIFEIQYHKVDSCNKQMLKLELSKEFKIHGSIAYKHIVNEMEDLDIEIEIHRESLVLRSCLRTIQRLTNGNCTAAVNVRLMMLVRYEVTCIRLINKKIHELSFITDLSVNKDELVYFHKQFLSERDDELCKLEEMLFGDDNYGRTMLKEEIFQEVTKLNDEEIEHLDKVFYNEESYEKRCPVCLNEHLDDELLVSLRCPCKKERLCQSCAFSVLKEKSQCPCCRSYV